MGGQLTVKIQLCCWYRLIHHYLVMMIRWFAVLCMIAGSHHLEHYQWNLKSLVFEAIINLWIRLLVLSYMNVMNTSMNGELQTTFFKLFIVVPQWNDFLFLDKLTLVLMITLNWQSQTCNILSFSKTYILKY